MLTDAQREKWQKDGYVRLERFFDPAAQEDISTFVEDMSRWVVSDDKLLIWFEKTRDNRKITSKMENFLDFHDPLRRLLLEDQRIKSAVEELLGEDSRRLKELLIFHYPDSGGYLPHQDIYHIPHKLPDRMVHAVVAIGIDDSDEENGGLFFSPGNHKKGVFPMDAGGVIDPQVAEKFSWEPVVWKSGDIFIFDDYAPHYSRPNKSNRSRRTLYLVFQRASTGGPTRAEYNVLKRALNPPEGKVADLDSSPQMASSIAIELTQPGGGMHTKLIDRSKMRGRYGRLICGLAEQIAEVVAGGLLCAYSPTSAPPLGCPLAGPELHYPGRAANGSGGRFSPRIAREAVALAAEGPTASTA
ncbi:phytanoyl-CoA dioxygenase family protein [Mesorhizobium sp. M0217]